MSGAGASSSCGRAAKRARRGGQDIMSMGNNNKHRVFAVYTYKGGAGKTTTTINIASVLATEFSKKVLLVDCDPQCNLSSFFLPEADENQNKNNGYDTETEDESDDPGEEPSQHKLPYIKVSMVEGEAETLNLALFRNGFKDRNASTLNV